MMKIIFCFLGLTMLLFSCKKYDFNISNLNGNEVAILGHGGMGIGHSYPMNTQESILNCLTLDSDGTELDVQMTKDGVLVAYHDETLDTKTNLSGRIHEKTWNEISDAYYTTPHFNGYHLMKLDDLFQNINHLEDYIFFLDIKNFNTLSDTAFYHTMSSEINKLIIKYNILQNTYVESKSETSILSIRSINPDIRQFIYSGYEKALYLAELLNVEGATLSYEDISKERVAEFHELGIKVATFNTHTQKRNIKAVEYNVDFIQTDKVHHLIKILE